MVFNSIFFFLTLVPLLSLYYLTHNRYPRVAKVATLAYSYFFYGMWNPWFLILIVGSTLVDYHAALAMRKFPERKRLFLIASLVANLGMLGFFKYYNFFSSGAVLLFDLVGFDLTPPFLDILLPVGISFYTFQTLSYSIDAYRGTFEPRESLLDVAFFVAYFPQLVAGPIVRADSFLPQLEANRRITLENIANGSTLIIFGLFLKTVIADNAAPRVNELFAQWQTNSGLENWAAAMLFGVQIHGDFSGYSLMAIGLAAIMGFHLPKNFDAPYGAFGFSDFWRRWHISLSSWLRDYLYIPLGGNRNGNLGIYRNLMITMLLGGLWHGASIMIVLWGGIHGLYLCVERALRNRATFLRNGWASRIAFFIGVPLTYLTISFTWIPFRSETPAQCFGMMRGLMDISGSLYPGATIDFVCIAMVFLIQAFWARHSFFLFLQKRPFLRFVFLTSCLVSIFYASGERSEFIYFQF